mmetsp:Transcript_109365/g.309379  ORF Transcript_109365/g.309379 Transcript_109365/m.309379 type:complete len:236 (-) Transcript_109365:568-1275(-)
MLRMQRVVPEAADALRIPGSGAQRRRDSLLRLRHRAERPRDLRGPGRGPGGEPGAAVRGREQPLRPHGPGVAQHDLRPLHPVPALPGAEAGSARGAHGRGRRGRRGGPQLQESQACLRRRFQVRHRCLPLCLRAVRLFGVEHSPARLGPRGRGLRPRAVRFVDRPHRDWLLRLRHALLHHVVLLSAVRVHHGGARRRDGEGCRSGGRGIEAPGSCKVYAAAAGRQARRRPRTRDE